MGKKAIISVISNANIEEDDMIEVVSPGSFEKIEDGFKATYEETEISGMEGTTTILTIKENQVILEREGTTSTKMIFKEDEDSIVLYNTPYGILDLNVDTKKLKINIDENGGEIHSKYVLGLEGQEGISTELSIKIKVN